MNPRRRREKKEMLKSVAQQKQEMKPRVVTTVIAPVVTPSVVEKEAIIEESFPDTEYCAPEIAYAPEFPEVVGIFVSEAEVEAPVEVVEEPVVENETPVEVVTEEVALESEGVFIETGIETNEYVPVPVIEEEEEKSEKPHKKGKKSKKND